MEPAYSGWSILSVTQKIHGVTIAGQMNRRKKMVMIASWEMAFGQWYKAANQISPWPCQHGANPGVMQVRNGIATDANATSPPPPDPLRNATLTTHLAAARKLFLDLLEDDLGHFDPAN